MDPRERRVKLKYRDHASVTGEVCFYCGGYGDQIDHYPPIAQADLVRASYGLRIRACARCNWNLGASVQASIEERKREACWDIKSRRERMPPRHQTKEDKEKYLRMERVLKAIARGEHWAGMTIDPKEDPSFADNMLDELIKEPDNGRAPNE